MSAEIRIVLVATSHPGNIGAAARAMHVMGLSTLVLVAPECEVAGEALARARGAAELVQGAQRVATLAEALAGTHFVIGTSARDRRLGPRTVAVHEGAGELISELAAGEAAILFGPERTGLDNAALDHCNRLWYIPTAGGHGSLNLAAAVQVIAYEILLAQGRAPVHADLSEVAPAEDVTALCAHFDRAARRLGVIAPEAPRFALRRMQRLARRARLEPSEVKLLRGFLRAAEAASAPPAATPQPDDDD